MDTENLSPVNLLFSRVSSRFDTQGKLEQPDDSVSLSELWRQLVSGLGVDDAALASMVADIAGLESITDLPAPDNELLAKVPYNIASTYGLLPLALEGNTIIIAITNPFDEALAELTAFIFGINTRYVVAPPGNLDVAIATAYEKRSGKEQEHLQLEELRVDSAMDRQVPRLARQLLKKALEKNASDLHIQDFVGGFAVRIRVDGLLQRLVILPNAVANGLIRYFKAMGHMDPTTNLKPQDGRVAVKLGDQDYDLRLSVIPTQGRQEKLVIRFLNRGAVHKLSTNSFSLEEIHTLRRLAASPSGVILICGPTGSGKTTTLYSILAELNSEQVSIATVENPVEYNMPGLAQTEVNEKAGVTFASALRSILRQDPDIILIGEIRDAETAQIAMQSALTGHLVFSTLHTNDALSAIPRLRDLGVPSAVLTESLVGLVSQRLLRKLCGHCKKPTAGELSPVEEGFHAVTQVLPGSQAEGCQHCNYTGYDGRIVISEMIEIDNNLRKLILKGEADIEKIHQAIGGHHQNLSVSASRLIISGVTTVEEAVRVIGRHFWIELAEEYKAEVPSLSVLNISGDQLMSRKKPGVLLTGSQQGFTENFCDGLTGAWFDVYTAESAEAGGQSLRDHEEISFVILDLVEAHSEQEAIDYVAEYRRALAWSRLPALIRLPEGREDLQEILVVAGATSRFASQADSLETIVGIINGALAANLDFSWGRSKK